jgi:two-component system LytT family sensor kinase
MSVSLFTVRRFLIIFSIAWVILMTDHAILLWWLDWPVELAIIDSLISNVLLLLVCLLVMNTIRYYVPEIGQYMNVLFMCIVLTILWLLLSKWLLGLALNSYEGYYIFLRRSLMVRFSTGFLILGIVTTWSYTLK